jgi:hypothetical protein
LLDADDYMNLVIKEPHTRYQTLTRGANVYSIGLLAAETAEGPLAASNAGFGSRDPAPCPSPSPSPDNGKLVPLAATHSPEPS